ncbi:MAG: Predicted amidohydrolase [uncultured Sulfurovum sp.]|uniref:Predicted amidohydrolase n=1 Tax=uncultured Sulfurovum sp. TaxID=269237 RepID=A0A6S6SKV7_9BACT|nr:MAG: Predicted amidohydrolase [uncultured Sulfurovum sp.]
MPSSKTLTIAALQLPTLGMQATKLDFYLSNAYNRNVKLVLLGEYVLNHFFKELPNIPIKMVKKQSDKHVELLKKFALKYQMVFIAPLIIIKKNQYIKTIVKITAKSTTYYEQQILMPYKHWNEKKMFANKIKKLRSPLAFKVEGFKIMAMGGFELHFGPFWREVIRKKIDLVLLPTASTFGSHNRWREIIKTKAFLHGCYILRANRLGEFKEENVKWKFYGDSMLVEPSGEIYMILEDKESMLIETISKNVIKEHKESWAFQAELQLRKSL